jgi:peroxiredoxin
MTRELRVDDRAPDFELVGGDGQTYRLSDFRGQPVVLAFYPKDFSGTCTKEHAGLVDAIEALERLDVQVLGVSVDHKDAHRAWAEQMGIGYPLLADFHPKAMVGRMYGVYNEETGFHNRWTFVIDPEGRIGHIQKSGIDEVPDVEEILAAVRELL